MNSIQQARQQVRNSFKYPFIFVGVLWVIKIVEVLSGIELYQLGVQPRHLSGLKGIFFMPFIHGDFQHLFSNSVPIIVMGFIIFQSYRQIAFELFLWIWVMTGVWVWIGAFGSGFHIGASGIVYGLAFFIFFSGVIRKDVKSIALALLVAFFYGGIVWGLLPIQEGVSWEGHLAGAISGSFCAWYFRNVNPPKKFAWELEEENENEIVENPFWVKKEEEPETEQLPNWKILYHFKPKDKE